MGFSCKKCDRTDLVWLALPMRRARTLCNPETNRPHVCGVAPIGRRVWVNRKPRVYENRRKADKDALGRSHYFHNTPEWRQARYDAILRAGGRCRACGRSPIHHGVALHVDHIVPRSVRPDLCLAPRNLQVLCEECNLGKAADDQTDFAVAVLNGLTPKPLFSSGAHAPAVTPLSVACGKAGSGIGPASQEPAPAGRPSSEGSAQLAESIETVPGTGGASRRE